MLWQDNNPAIEPSTQPPNAPDFVDMVRAELQQTYGINYWKQGAWKVKTTLDASLQNSAEKLVAENLPNIQSRTAGLADEEAIVLEDVTTGQIRALVGNSNNSNKNFGQINFATTPISPGSSIKPFDYAALIENTTNTGAGSVISDSLKPLPGYPCTNTGLPMQGGNCPQDYDFLSPGNIPIRYALGGNRNIPAEEAMMNSLPTDTSADRAKADNQVINLIDNSGASNGYNCYRPGVDISTVSPTDKTQCYESAALGDGAFITLTDETHALATLANNGRKVPQTTIMSVSLNSKIKTSWKNPTGQQIIKPDVAYIINDIMSDPNASYLPGSCTATTCTTISSGGYKFQRDNGWTLAVDDGTTNSGFGATLASWSAKYAVVSWVGNHTQNVDISSITGSQNEQLTIPLTRGLMEDADEGVTPATWNEPKDIKVLPAFVLTKHIHYGDVEPSPAYDLYPSWYR
jgi:membrane peptidoglycan carboxypeptidase